MHGINHYKKSNETVIPIEAWRGSNPTNPRWKASCQDPWLPTPEMASCTVAQFCLIKKKKQALKVYSKISQQEGPLKNPFDFPNDAVFRCFFRDFDGSKFETWKKPQHWKKASLPALRKTPNPCIFNAPLGSQCWLIHKILLALSRKTYGFRFISIEVDTGSIQVIYFTNFTNLSSKFWTRPCFESNSPRRYLITKFKRRFAAFLLSQLSHITFHVY